MSPPPASLPSPKGKDEKRQKMSQQLEVYEDGRHF